MNVMMRRRGIKTPRNCKQEKGGYSGSPHADCFAGSM